MTEPYLIPKAVDHRRMGRWVRIAEHDVILMPCPQCGAYLVLNVLNTISPTGALEGGIKCYGCEWSVENAQLEDYHEQAQGGM